MSSFACMQSTQPYNPYWFPVYFDAKVSHKLFFEDTHGRMHNKLTSEKNMKFSLPVTLCHMLQGTANFKLRIYEESFGTWKRV